MSRIFAALFALLLAFAAHAQVGGPVIGQAAGGGAAAGGTITGGTNNSVLFVNPASTIAQDNPNFTYTIGTTTLAAPTIQGTTGFLMPDGSKTSPSWQWNSDNDGTGTGFYRRAANVLTAATNGVDTMEIAATRVNVNSGVCFGWSSSASTVNAQVTQLCARTGGAVFTGVAVAMQISYTQTTVPTCSSNCGTSPTVVGSDSAMRVTMGATGVPASGWVVTFNGTWPSAPVCIVQSALTTMVVGKMPIAVQTSTTTITVTTNGTAPATSDQYEIQCNGVS